jgi:hypothetical protein
LPFPETADAGDIWSNSATFHGSVELDGRAARVGFQVRKAGARRWLGGRTPWQRIPKGTSGHFEFTAGVSNLLPATDYEYRAVAMLHGRRRNGNGVVFRTPSTSLSPPVVTASPLSSVAAGTDVTLTASNPNPDSVAFEWFHNGVSLGAPTASSTLLLSAVQSSEQANTSCAFKVRLPLQRVHLYF